MYAGCFILGLPETHGLPLPETIADVVSRSQHGPTASAVIVLKIDSSEDGSATTASTSFTSRRQQIELPRKHASGAATSPL
jgi:hypothetical protein